MRFFLPRVLLALCLLIGAAIYALYARPAGPYSIIIKSTTTIKAP